MLVGGGIISWVIDNNMNSIISIMIERKIKHVRGDVSSWIRVTHKIHEHWSPMNNDDSTVTLMFLKELGPSVHNICGRIMYRLGGALFLYARIKSGRNML